jgi:hypothetical protein
LSSFDLFNRLCYIDFEAMASCSLFQPPISAGVTSQSLVGPKDVSACSSLHPSMAMASSASHLKVEAASMCSSASLKTQGSGQLVSQFWSTNSRRGLLARANASEMACRPRSALVVVRLHILSQMVGYSFYSTVAGSVCRMCSLDGTCAFSRCVPKTSDGEATS